MVPQNIGAHNQNNGFNVEAGEDKMTYVPLLSLYHG